MRTGARFKGLVNGYEEPARLGVDRWAAMIGARMSCAGALCVVDSGTATTVDVIQAERAAIGGAICCRRLHHASLAGQVHRGPVRRRPGDAPAKAANCPLERKALEKGSGE